MVRPSSALTLALALTLASLLAVCAPPPSGSPLLSAPPTATARVLDVMTHDSFDASQEVVARFESTYSVHVNFLKSGDAGAALNKAILSESAPLADVFYGVDNTFLSRALDANLYDAYASPLLASVPDAFKLDPRNRALPVDYGDVCINYDKAYFASHALPLPQTLEDLTRPIYKGLLVVENPATSSPGLAFLLATIAHFGPDHYLDYWRQLRQNGLTVVDDWGTAYDTNFSGSSGKGAQPLVVSYTSSPPAEVVYATTPLSEAPTGSLTGPGMCFRQIEFVGILHGTANRDLAEHFVDFMLGVPFQEDMPLKMFVYPVNREARLPDPFVKFTQIPEQLASMAPETIAANREAWVEAWREAVLQ